MATEHRKMLSQMVRLVLVAWLMGAALAGTAVAGPFEDGVSAYERGDYAEAVKWYRKAAEQGNAGAQFSLGFSYIKGEGVPQDYAEAVKWYRKAADQGATAAQLNLGLMYKNGWGGPQDYVQAHKWFNLAASRLPASGKGRDMAAEYRDSMAAEMTRAQIVEAQKLAREWKPKER